MVYESQRAGVNLSREGLPLSRRGPGQLQKQGGVRAVQAMEHLARRWPLSTAESEGSFSAETCWK